MPISSPRALFRGLRPVPLEWPDERMTTLALAVKQLQTRSLIAPRRAVTVSATYSVLDVDGLILAGASAAALTVFLPTAAGREGRRIVVKKTDATGNAVTIDASGAETIDGTLSVGLTTQYAVRELISDDANWWIVSAA